MAEVFSTEVAGRKLTIETGKLAPQANGSCMVRYGDTVILATAVISHEPKEGADFFPLLVDYEERLYAAGKIKGSRFVKREGRATEEATLTARIVDRSIRPLFNDKMRNDVQVVLTVLSIDQENLPDIVALWAAVAALELSDIPWGGPLGGLRIGRKDGQFIVNPTAMQRAESDFDLFVVGKDDKIVMIELDGKQVDEQSVADAMELAQKEWQPVLALIAQAKAKVGHPKMTAMFASLTEDEQKAEAMLRDKVQAFTDGALHAVWQQPSKAAREAAITKLKGDLDEALKKDNDVSKELRAKGELVLEELLDAASRTLVLKEKKRVDGRALDEIRPLSAEVGLLPRTHGSGLFQRGETQVLSVVTLGSPGDEQTLDTMEESGTKRYMHHYNFPGYSTGEVKPMRSPGRREIGHGALAEKSLVPVLPPREEFPYTIRVVSEVLSSNGSTSQASVCGSTLALLDAGVPIKAPVAGISIGLVTDESGEAYELLTDIQGIEDHAGDMDFKVAGTKDGITAIQLDVKAVRLTMPMVRETFERAKKARMQILDVLHGAIAETRKEMSPYAPRIFTLRIDKEQIGEVIGKGGETINGLIERCGGKDVTKIDIEEDGLVIITSTKADLGEKAKSFIENLTKEVLPGEIYEGTVTRVITDARGFEIGAIVEFLPGKDGMVHVSELSYDHVEKVTDVMNVGDTVKVVVVEVDKERGRIALSVKRLQQPPEGYAPAPHRGDDRPPRRPFGGGFRGRGGPDRGGRGGDRGGRRHQWNRF